MTLAFIRALAGELESGRGDFSITQVAALESGGTDDTTPVAEVSTAQAGAAVQDDTTSVSTAQTGAIVGANVHDTFSTVHAGILE